MATARQLAVTYRRVEELVPYTRNARTHSKQQIQSIANSMKAFGWTNPILIDGTGGIIAGHGRVLAAVQLKLKRVPCIELAGLTEQQRQAYILADNQLATHAGWDLQILASEMKGLQASGFNLELAGFSKSEINNLIGADAPVRTGKTPDDAPPPGGPLVSRPGDLWSCGRHRVMCGDSTIASDVDTLLQADVVDLIWTDPPYNVAYESAAGSISNDNLKDADFAALLDQAFRNCYRRARPGAVMYVAHADSARVVFTEAYVAAGFKLAQVLIWVKQHAVLSRQDYNWQHEPILYGWREGGAHYFCGDFSKTTTIDDDLDLKRMKRDELEALVAELMGKAPTTVVRQDRPIKSEMHPTMKPVALVQQLLANSALEGQVVLDVFAGSGTTMIAAEKLGMQSRLMELEPRFADVCVRRWEAFTGKSATHVGSGKEYGQVQAERTPSQKSDAPA